MDNPSNPTQPQTSSTSLYDLMKSVLLDSSLSAEQKVKLIDELRNNNPTTSDRWAYRWAIWILGLAVVITIICLTILAYKGSDIPDGLIAIGSGVAGGIAGLLSPPQRASSENQP